MFRIRELLIRQRMQAINALRSPPPAVISFNGIETDQRAPAVLKSAGNLPTDRGADHSEPGDEPL